MAQGVAKRPSLQEELLGRWERHAEQGQNDVIGGQVEDEEVRDGLHLLRAEDDIADEAVAEQWRHEDDRVEADDRETEDAICHDPLHLVTVVGVGDGGNGVVLAGLAEVLNEEGQIQVQLLQEVHFAFLSYVHGHLV